MISCGGGVGLENIAAACHHHKQKLSKTLESPQVKNSMGCRRAVMHLGHFCDTVYKFDNDRCDTSKVAGSTATLHDK